MVETLVKSETLLDIRDLKMHFPVTQGIIIQREVGQVRAVDGVSFTIERGKTLGLVGESGSGKTTIGRTIIRLYKPTAGQIFFENQDLAKLKWRAVAPDAPKRTDGVSRSLCFFECALHDWIIDL